MEEKTKTLVPDEQNVDGELDRGERRRLTTEEAYGEYLKMARMEVNVANADNKFLEPLAAGPFTIGCVDEVNGSGAAEIPEFNATRHELLQLVKYWAQAALDSEYWVFVTSQIGSTDLRVQPFAYNRISRIASLLGEAEVQKVVAQVEKEFGEAQDPKVWEIFLHGTADERRQLQEVLEAEFKASSQRKSED
jgi:hypothetical protein